MLLTQHQRKVEKLLYRILEDVLPNGKVDDADEVYTPDVIGHYRHEVVYLEDIKNRIRAIRDKARDCNFTVLEIVHISDELVTYSTRQSWRNKVDDSFHSLLMFGTYKIRQFKVCELWLMLDIDTKYYSEIQNFAMNMRGFEHHQKTKEDFLYKLTVPNNHRGMSATEKECLYYYFNGFSAKEAAIEMGISPRTVETHIAEIKSKLDCRTKPELRRKIFPKPL